MTLSNVLGESSDSLGKSAMAKRLESAYGYAFLSTFWSAIFLILSCLIFNTSFHFSVHSLPFFIPRVILEVIIAYLGAKAISVAELSTFAFLRLITVPLLLFIDISLGHKISVSQILGVMIIFGALVYLLGRQTLNPKGARLVILIGALASITLSLYKYDITHYNSVAAEQLLVYLAIMIYCTAAAWHRGRERTWAYLFKERTEFQSLFNGLAGVLSAYAYLYVPASIAVTYSRATEVLFAMIFGNLVFHEKKFNRKLAGLSIVILALVFLGIKS